MLDMRQVGEGIIVLFLLGFIICILMHFINLKDIIFECAANHLICENNSCFELVNRGERTLVFP